MAEKETFIGLNHSSTHFVSFSLVYLESLMLIMKLCKLIQLYDHGHDKISLMILMS